MNNNWFPHKMGNNSEKKKFERRKKLTAKRIEVRVPLLAYGERAVTIIS